MGYLATGEIFENMLQLKRFGLYFEGIMNILSYRNNEINYRDAKRFGSMLLEANFIMIDAIWCVFDALF